MQIDLATGFPQNQHTGVLVVGAFSDAALTGAAKAVDTATQGKLTTLIERGDLGPKAGDTVTLYDVTGCSATRILLVSLGKMGEFSEAAYRKAVASAAKILAESKAEEAVVTLAEIDVPGRMLPWKIREASRLLADARYRFALPGGTMADKSAPARPAGKIVLLLPDIDNSLERAVSEGLGVAEGMALAKDLGNLPGNFCNPAHLAKTASDMGREFSFKVDVLERDDLEKLGMGSFLSVGRASANPCKMIVMHYMGGPKEQPPVVLVGKGITFDTGGVSLKPGANLDEMKFDMGGAGAVIGVMKSVVRLALKLNVICIVAAAENMPGGNASRPGDVVRSMSGLTIEILNTDAEGRLVLCDALTYAERFKPACVIDVATLTGACVIALGAHASGLYANDETLASELLASGRDTGDRAWQMPLWDDYMSQLKTNFADISNLGGAPAGSIMNLHQVSIRIAAPRMAKAIV